MADTVHGTNGAGTLQTLAALQSRTELAQRLGFLYDGARRINDVLGYKARLEFRDFKARYLRQDVAHRLVKAYPEATWSQPPTVCEDETSDQPTAFEQAWSEMATRVQVFAALERADLLANLGQYSIVLIGLMGQDNLALPATPVSDPASVLYLTPYSEEFARVQALETDASQPGFGRPRLYRLDIGRSAQAGEMGRSRNYQMVHASRVIHVAEDTLDDDVYGIPRLEPVWDRLDDLLKVVGGSAEMFWRDAKRRLAFETRDGYSIRGEDEADVVDDVEEFVHNLKDWIRVEGVNVKDLSGIVASPREHADVYLDLISAATSIPKRILLGSERGQLASSQDEHAWLGRIVRRQTQFAEARMLRPLIDRLLRLGALPQPATPYRVEWENLYALSEEKQATVAKDVASALAQYAGPGLAPSVVPEAEFRERYLGLPPVSPYEAAEPPDAPEEM